MDIHADWELLKSDAVVLGAIAKLLRDPDLAMAVSTFGRFSAVKTNTLALSRENTNVRSLAISLTQKRRIALLCQENLAALRQAIAEEQDPGGTSRKPAGPR